MFSSNPKSDIRILQSPLAGRWYDASPEALADEIDQYITDADQAPLDSVLALVLPHAGYAFSGPTAAHGIKLLKGRSYSRVVVLGPSHSVPMNNMASVPDVTHYSTILGETPIDIDFVTELKKHPSFSTIAEAHMAEHSVQIELPLLQRVLGDFKLVPVVVGQIDSACSRAMATVLSALIDDQTLVIVSSDFTHFGARFAYTPFEDDLPANIEKLDMGAFEHIASVDPDAFHAYVRRTGATICGKYPIGILLSMLRGDVEAHMLHYDTSGRITNDTRNSVSYMSVAFTGKWTTPSPPKQPEHEYALSDEDKASLLQLARSALTYHIEHNKAPLVEELGIEITPGMQQHFGAFVTLHKGKELRGCIGEIIPVRPLYEAVLEQALNSGLRDYRFTPVQHHELEELTFEISGLTPSRPVESYRDIVLGKHGIVLSKGSQRAVFLPQVAPEQGWNLEQTLTCLAQKAGLPPDAWREGAEFTVFEAIVFCEPSS